MYSPPSWLARTHLLLNHPLEVLQNNRVAIIGLGGVGGAAAEAICRAGIHSILIMDPDTVSITNLNRQLLATQNTIGKAKAVVGKDRLLSINPDCKVEILSICYNEKQKESLFSYQPDYVIDAIDMVNAKLSLILNCRERNIPIVSALGTGNRLDPTSFRMGSIQSTSGCGCPLARVMRRLLKQQNIYDHPVVYSVESPRKAVLNENRRHPPGSISYCPPVAGYLLASYVVNHILSKNNLE